ncbi:MAG: DNA topoisomerase VI subunit B, partial [Desulfurococcales archaeon]|nr:DNA topoisomerase VI subunit B [Desulfurococcales archaeon]
QEVARRLKTYLTKKRRQEEVRRKIITVAKYIPEVARSLAILAKPPEKWSPPRPEEERKIMEALIRLVSNYVEVPELPGGERRSAEEIVRSVIEEVEVE